MILKTTPTINGYNVEFIGNNKKGENLNLKVWIDLVSYNTIIANPSIDADSKLYFLQNCYEDKQKLRSCERCGNYKIMSLDSLREETGFEPEYNDPDPFEIEEFKIRTKALHEAIAKTLTENERIVIKCRYNGEVNVSSTEISKVLDLSERHIRSLHKQALDKLKNFLIANYHEVFVDFK